MKIKLLILLLLLGFTSLAQAQTANPGSKLAYDQGASSLAEANSFGVNLYLDSAPAVINVSKTCIGATSPFTCTVNFPPLTAGPHTLQATATLGTYETPKSVVFNFSFIAVPTPSGIRIVEFKLISVEYL